MQEQTNRLSSLGRLLFLLFISYAKWSAAITPSSLNEPPAIGNFTLATSQQPGPFFLLAKILLIRNNLLFRSTPITYTARPKSF